MISASNSSAKQPTVCRYFMKGGACYYGDDCQFVHITTTNTSDSNLVPNVTLNSDVDGHGADAETAATFPQQQINGLPSESKLHMFLNVQRSLASTSPTDEKTNAGLQASFSAMNLETDGNFSVTPNSVSNDFNTHTSVDSTLTHSSSSPSFLLSNSNSAAAKPTFSRFQNWSPNGSPRLTPSHSPLIERRNKSPLPNIPVTDQSDETVNQPLYQESVGGTTYYFTPDQASDTNGADVSGATNNVIVPDLHVYHANPSHIEHLQPKTSAPSYFMPDELRLDILHRQALMMAHVDLKQYPDLPSEVDQYNNLCPLESTNSSDNAKSFGYTTTVYKANNIKTGIYYCLRRIHGFRLVSTKCMSVVDMWKNLQHSNLVQLREVFTTKAFGGEHSIVFVHDYHPGAQTLMNHYFTHSHSTAGFGRGNGIYGPEGAPRPFSQSKPHLNSRLHTGFLPEAQIWGYIVQISSVLRTIHASGLACRTLDPSKILVTAKSRLRINCCGIIDILTFDHNQPNPMAHTQHYQQEDLVSFGKIILALACNSITSVQRENIQGSVELITRHYSSDLRGLILYLVSNQVRVKSINDVMPMIGARFYIQLDAAQLRNDVIENELAKEVNNGRLYRLIAKISMITERPEFNMDPTWAETGDRYMLKLFRDYVFHLVTDNGLPWIDMAHVVHCLNKLDAGVPEKLCLSSRDEQNVLVVTYAELKRCFETAFAELVSSTVQINKSS